MVPIFDALNISRISTNPNVFSFCSGDNNPPKAAALGGLLSPEQKENTLGLVEIREIFKASKIGTIAGCYVLDGLIRKNSKIRLLRDSVVIYDGELDSLKRFKDDIKEVKSNFECGLSIKNYNDMKVGDQIEVYELVEVARKL